MPSGTSSVKAGSAVAVFCGSSIGKYSAFTSAAKSLGSALVADDRPLVYGGGSQGIMGVVSGTVIAGGGNVIGVIPSAMIDGNLEKKDKVDVQLSEEAQAKIETIVVESMHERKVMMAARSEGFIGLPGGFGTFEEVMEVATWTQLGIHDKPVVLLNVLSFWEPLRLLIRSSIDAGFVSRQCENLVLFVDGPQDTEEHENFDWGKAALEALDGWKKGEIRPLYVWSKEEGTVAEDQTYKET